MIGFLRETSRLAIDPWRRLDRWMHALIAAVPAWGLALAVMFGSFPFWSFSGGAASAALPPVVDPPVPGAMATMRFEDGNVVLYARGVDGTWEEVKPVDQSEAPGQFAKFATTSPDRRLVSYVKADDQLMNNARISIVDIETGQERELAVIPEGFFPATPVWSPDASRIAFAKKEGDHIELWVVHVATGELVKVPTEEPISPQAFYGANPNPLVWSADGESLSYDVPDLTGRRMVHYNVDLASGDLKKKRGNELPEEQPCEIPVFSQNDPTWAGSTMQELGDTIGAAGCALTSTAMVLNYYGNNRDPGELNTCLGAAAEPVYWAVAAQRNCNDGSAQFEDYVAFSWDTLASLMAEGRPVVLGFAGGISGSHYVVVKSGFGTDGANYSIIDPWDGTTWKTIDYYAEKGYSPEWLVIYRGEEGDCTARTTAPPVKAPDLSFGSSASGVEGTWQWRPLIEQVAGETGVDPDVMQAIMALESGGDPNVVGPYTGSLGEAMGLMQVMNGLDGPWNFVAQYTGHYPSHAEMLVPLNNIRAGAYELKWRHDLGGNWSDWLITAVGYFGATTPDGQITGARDAFGTDGWAYYDRVRANLIAIRQRLGTGVDLPPPPNDVRRPAEWPPAGTIEMLLGGADYTISQNFGYTGFTPSPGAYDYASAYGLNAGDHAAIDIAIPYGTPLYAPISTSVLYASSDIYFAPNHVDLAIPGMGGCAEVIFGHMSTVQVSVGQSVQPRTYLGDSGTAGTGPHVHLEVRVPDATTSSGCRAVDPRIFFGMGGDFAQLPRPDGAPAPAPAPAPDQPDQAPPPDQPGPAPTDTPTPTQTPEPTGTATATGTVEPTATGQTVTADATFTPTATETGVSETDPTSTPGDGTPVPPEATSTLLAGDTPAPGSPTAPAAPPILRGGVQDQLPPPGAPGSGRLPGTPTPVPTMAPVRAQDLPVVTVIGPQDWQSYDAPVTFERYILDFPQDRSATVSVDPPVGTTFTREGTYTIQVTVTSPEIPGGILTHTITFFIDYSAPDMDAQVTGRRFQPQPDTAQREMGWQEFDIESGSVRALAAPSLQQNQTVAPTSCYDGEAVISFAYDDSGTPIIAAAYRIDGGRWRYYTNNAIPHPISLRRHGSHSLEYYAVDAAGNQSLSQTLSLCVVANPAVPIDEPEPTPTITPSPTPEERIGEERDPDLRVLEPDQLPATPTAIPPTATTAPTPTEEASPAPASPTAAPPTVTATATTTPTATPEPTATATNTPEPPTQAPPQPIVVPPTNTPTEVIVPPTRTPTATVTSTPTEEVKEEPAPASPTVTVTATVTVTPSPEPSTGSVEILKRDADDQPLAGACFSLEPEAAPDTSGAGDGAESREACDENDGANDGTILFGDLPPGGYNLVEESPPPGYAPVAPNRITVEAGQTLTYEVANTTRLGSVEVAWAGEQDAPQPAACFELFAFGGLGGPGQQIRDEQCINESVPTITFADLVPGNYVVVQSQTPDNYQTANPLFVPVLSGATTSVTIRNELLSGAVTVAKVDAGTGEPLPGACFDVYTDDGGERGTRVNGACDDADGAADGSTTIADLPPKDYLVAETQAPPNYETAPDQPVSVAPSGTAEVTVEDRLILGSLTIQKTNAVTSEPVPGACFAIYAATDVDFISPVKTMCDSEDGADDGTISASDLSPGDYVLVETVFPPGFNPAADQPFTVAAGTPTNLVVPNEPVVGGLRITKYPEDNEIPLPGACFDIHQDDGAGGPGALVTSVCDNADGADDGIAEVSGLDPGGYVIVETTVPTGYLPAPNTPATVTADLMQDVSIIDPVQRSTLTVSKVDENGVLLNGACFDLYTSAGGSPDVYIAGGCDGQQITTAGGATTPDTLDGAMTFGDLEAGVYIVDETVPPTGYEGSAPTEVTIAAGQNAAINVVNTNNPVGDAEVTTYRDSGGEWVQQSGVCIAIYDAATFGSSEPPVAQQCDDDANAVLLFTNLPSGQYVAYVSDAPEGLQSGGSVPFEVTTGAMTPVEVLVPWVPFYTVTIRTIDNYSDALVHGACYRVFTADDTTLASECDGNNGAGNGLVDFSLPAGGPYYLEQTTTPPEYYPAGNQEFSLSDELTLTVGIDPFATPTPPPEGSIRVSIFGPDDVPLEGSCIYVVSVDEPDGVGGTYAESICDSTSPPAPDGNPDGIVLFAPLAPGEYRVNQESAPPGYEVELTNHFITVTGGATHDVVFRNEPTSTTGTITVVLTNGSTGDPLADGHFILWGPSETFIAEGSTDSTGVYVFSEVAPLSPDEYCIEPVDFEGWTTPDWQCTTLTAGQEVTLHFESNKVVD